MIATVTTTLSTSRRVVVEFSPDGVRARLIEDAIKAVQDRGVQLGQHTIATVDGHSVVFEDSIVETTECA